MLNISNTHLVLPKKSEVKKIVSSGTSVLHATFSNITTIQTQPLANFTISKCELEEEHCGINIQDFKLNKIDTVTIVMEIKSQATTSTWLLVRIQSSDLDNWDHCQA